MLHYNRWDCDSLRSLHKFGLAKNPALYLRFWSLYSKLHKFALAKSEIWTLTYRTIGFSSIATDTKRKGSRRLPCLTEKRWDCDSLRSLHKFGLAKNSALRLRFWSLTYRTIGFSSIATDTKMQGSLWLPCLIEKKVGLRLASLAA